MFTTSQIILYVVIFVSKVIENALGTLRLIVVANGKKGLGALLQGLIALVWVLVTGTVVVDVLEDPMKIIAFALGSLAGSWLGSYLEEKLAIGDNMLITIIDDDLKEAVVTSIRNKGFAVTILNGEGKDKKRAVLMIMVSRKQRHQLVSIIKSIDSNAMIVSENASSLHGGYTPIERK